MIYVWGNQFSLNYLILAVLVKDISLFCRAKPNSAPSLMFTAQTPAFTGPCCASQDPGQLGEESGTMSRWEESSSPGILWELLQGCSMQPVHPPIHPLNTCQVKHRWCLREPGKGAIPTIRSGGIYFHGVAGERNASDTSSSWYRLSSITQNVNWSLIMHKPSRKWR